MRKLITAMRLTVTAVALLLFCGVALKAQVVTTANINGTVTDATGAVIPGATITATNVNTGIQTTTTTDKDGLYNIRFLAIGTYTVTFDAQGFGKQITKPFVLELAQTALIPAKLSPASASTSVEVQSTLAPLLNTENAQQDTTLDARAVANIPLFGRTLTDLTQLQPGAISTTPNSVGSNISVNGSRYQGNNYNLDGIETNQNIDYGQTYQPNPDAVEQVQMVSATASAEYGNTEGSTFLTVLKSGTNQYHGNAFMNLHNYLMDANTYGNKHNSVPFIPRSAYTQYQMGGTLGGPIIKDKLFAFGDYQGYRRHSTSNGLATVATYDERGCSGGLPGSTCTGGTQADFSELLNSTIMCNLNCTNPNAKQMIQLFNPANNFAPYANNQGIPINSSAAKYLFAHNNLYPLPGAQLGINGVTLNATGHTLDANGLGGNNNQPGYDNVSTISKAFSHSDQYDVKVDYKLSSKDSMSGSYSHYNTLGYTTPTLPINFPTETPQPYNIIVFDEIHTFSSAIVNDFRAGFMRYVQLGAATIDTSGAFGTNGDTLLGIGTANGGIKQAFAGYAGFSSGAPGTLSGTYTAGRTGSEAFGGNTNTGTNIVENTFLYADTLTWLKDKHTFKGGINIGRYQQNNFYPGNDGSLGILTFNGNFTDNLISDTTDPRYPTAYVTGPTVYDTRGYNYADYVSDQLAATGIGGVSGYVGMRQYRDAYFIQDDWKIRPNLTLNLGFRYEYNTQISEVNNKYVAPDPVSNTLVIAGTSAANTYCPGCGRTLVHPFYGGALPRIGFNWAAMPRLVVRGGFGTMQFMEGTGANLRMTTNPPFQNASESGASVPTTTGDPGAPYSIAQGFNHTAVGAAPSGGTLNLWEKNVRPAYVQNYSLGVEYQINNTSSISLAYVGKSGQHLISAGGANQLPKPCTDPSYVTPSNPLGFNQSPQNTTTGPCLVSDPAPFQGVPGVGYDGVIRETQAIGAENNNSFQAVVRQRAWHGLQYTFNFTWSHAMTTSTGFYNGSAYAQNFYNNHAEYAPTVEDVKLASNWNMVYSLPFGRGKEFGGSMPFILDELVGGWNVAMTGLEQTGLPVPLSTTTATNYMHGSGGQRFNNYRPLKVTSRTANHWYGLDPSTVACSTPGVDNGVCAYGAPALGTFGSASYNALRQPGFQLYNAAVNKDFTIWHEHAINFRCDALNVFNQSELTTPNANPLNNTISGGAVGGTFGQITGVRSTNRQLQLTVAYHF